MGIINIENLSFKYNGSDCFALKNVNLEVERGSFNVICGESGCGKSTLLRLIKKQLIPVGELTGSVRYEDVEIRELDQRIAACEIGYVMQNPENQTVTDKVWHELAFGLESLGEDSGTIRRKVAEISGYFGINDWYRKNIDELSGGQKQLLSLAAIMVMQPKVLLLDEPTSQLDPVAASGFMATLKKLNNELGLTIILAEHRLEEVFPIADRVIIMNKAGILLCDKPDRIGALMQEFDPDQKMHLGLPTAVRIFHELGGKEKCPITVREGRDFLVNNYSNNIKNLKLHTEMNKDREKVVEIEEAFFRYDRESPDVMEGASLDVYQGELLCVLGANGAGKTTLLGVIGGINKLYRGQLRIYGKKIKEYNGVALYRNNIALLPQNPLLMFIKNTVQEDLKEVTALFKLSKEDSDLKIREICEELDIVHLLEKHPYDLSGGEQQKAAMAKLLLMNPRLILLDEPTKGIDAYSKKALAEILARLKANGKTVIIVTHDVEFAAEHADRCAMFFDGKIVSTDIPEIFFSRNNYYTTSASRISRDFFEYAVTAGAVVRLCRLNNDKK